jgi:hypothetical protein
VKKKHKCHGCVAKCAKCHDKTYEYSECKCNIENALIIPFARHSWYTTLSINTFLLNAQNASAMGASLAETASSISKVVQKYTTVCIYKRMQIAVKNHIDLAGIALALLKQQSPKLSAAIDALFKQTSELARVFSDLNPCVLTYKIMKKMWMHHVEYVVEIATLVSQKKYTEANISNNGYTDQMNEMSLMIADGLAQGYCCDGTC